MNEIYALIITVSLVALLYGVHWFWATYRDPCLRWRLSNRVRKHVTQEEQLATIIRAQRDDRTPSAFYGLTPQEVLEVLTRDRKGSHA